MSRLDASTISSSGARIIPSSFPQNSIRLGNAVLFAYQSPPPLYFNFASFSLYCASAPQSESTTKRAANIPFTIAIPRNIFTNLHYPYCQNRQSPLELPSFRQSLKFFPTVLKLPAFCTLEPWKREEQLF